VGGVGGHVRLVAIEAWSLTETPPASPVTVAVLGTTDGVQSAAAVVFREQLYVHVSPGSSVLGVSSGPFPTISGELSQLGSLTRTSAAAKGTSPGFLT
jgi:hypothetical protein